MINTRKPGTRKLRRAVTRKARAPRVRRHKKGEEALNESEERFRSIAERSYDAITAIDTEGRFTFVSTSIERITGYRPEELIGAPFQTFAPESEMPKVLRAYDSMMRGESIEGLQVEVKRKDGSLAQVEINGSAIRRNGRVVGMQGIIRDITERKRAEEALYESEAKYRTLVEQSLQGILIAQGPPPRLVFANLAMAKILGYTPEELTSLSPKETEGLIHPEDRVMFFGRFSDRLQGRLAPSRYEIRGIRKDGQVRWLDFSPKRIEYRGRPAVQATFVDITERKQIEEKLKESEDRFRGIAERSFDIILTVDLEGKVTYASPAVERITGYRRDEVVGASFQKFLPESEILRGIRMLSQAIEGEIAEKVEADILKEDGSIARLEFHASPILKDGKLAGFQGIARDITERKRVEDALRESEQKLKAVVHGSPIPQFVIDRNHTVIYWNKALEEITGVKAEQVVGTTKQWSAFYSEPRPCMADLLVDGRTEQISQLYAGKSGKSALIADAYEATDYFSRMGKEGRWLYFTAAVIKDAESNVTGAVETLEDITERVRAEEKLRGSEERYRSLYENSTDAVLLTATDGRIFSANPEACRMLQRSEAEICQIGRNGVVDLNDPRLPLALQERARTGRFRGELNLKRKDGTIFPAEISTNVFKAADEPEATSMIIRDITERKRAEEALRQSEERFSRIFQFIPDSLAISRLEDGIYVDVNKAFTERSGFAKDEVIGRSSLPSQTGMWVNSENRDKFARALRENGKVTEFETIMRMKDRSTKIVLLTARIIEIRGQSYVLTIAHDVTERKRLEDQLKRYSEHLEELVEERTRALRESESKYRSLVENIPDVTWTTDRNGRTVFISPNVVRVEGYTPEEICAGGPSQWYGRVHPDDLRRVREAFDSLFTKGKMYDIEYRVQRKDGNWIWVQERAVATHEEGGVQYADGVYADITERKQAELALAESEKKYRQLVQFAQEGLYNYDANAVVTFINPFLSRMLGYTPEEMIGKSLLTFVDEQDVNMVKAQIERRRRGIANTYEVRHIRKDGSRIYVSVTASPIIGEDGKFAGGLALLTDITERKRLQARLAESQRLAAIGETTTMIGHDLRNPLQAMVGTLFLAKRLMSSDKMEDRRGAAGLLATLDGQIEYMDKIVSDLQDYARPVEADRVETNLPDLVKAIAASLKIPEDVEVSVDIEAKLSSVRLDPVLFRRVLTNLILNAAQAMPKGGKLTITGSRGEDFVIVAVQDTGVGIAPENLQKVFTPFFTTKAQGQGLGLAVCKRLTEAQGGTITVASQVGEGSTFTLKIPTNQTRVAS